MVVLSPPRAPCGNDASHQTVQAVFSGVSINLILKVGLPLVGFQILEDMFFVLPKNLTSVKPWSHEAINGHPEASFLGL